MKGSRLLWCVLLCAACDTDESDAGPYGAEDSPAGGLSDEMPEDLPAGGCDDADNPEDCESGGESSGSSSGVDAAAGASVPSETPCERTEDCSGAGACVAVYDGEGRGDFECRFACVPTVDESAWCSDDASCCDPDAVCTARGYCVVTEDGAEDQSGAKSLGGTRLSDEMPEDLPAGGKPPSETVGTPPSPGIPRRAE